MKLTLLLLAARAFQMAERAQARFNEAASELERAEYAKVRNEMCRMGESYVAQADSALAPTVPLPEDGRRVWSIGEFVQLTTK